MSIIPVVCIEIIKDKSGRGVWIHDRTYAINFWTDVVARGNVRRATRELKRDAWYAQQQIDRLRASSVVVKGKSLEYWVMPDVTAPFEISMEYAKKLSKAHHAHRYTKHDLSE